MNTTGELIWLLLAMIACVGLGAMLGYGLRKGR
jgi:hypothetical protein